MIDIQGLSSIFQPQPWIPAIPLDSLGFPGIPGISGIPEALFLKWEFQITTLLWV